MSSSPSSTKKPRSPKIPSRQGTLALTRRPDAEILLVIFIHGFKGTHQSFEEFPERLEHLLLESLQPMSVKCLVFPAYETRGELDKAVIRFSDWLTTLTVEREVAAGGGAGQAKIVLCGHSMGGILAADTLRAFAQTRPEKSCPLWPRIIACIAFDTPYFGIHPFVVKNGITKAAEYATAAKTVGSAIFGSFAALSAKKATTSASAPASPAQANQSGWGSWSGSAFALGGALLAGAAAGGAYYKRDDLTQGFSWATDHMQYVGSLFDENGLNQRVEELIDIEKEEGVVFHTLYTQLPPKAPDFLVSRTFIVLPKYGSRAKDHFTPANNGIAPDEIQGHTGMFSASSNDGYYQLGLTTAKIIRDAVISRKFIAGDTSSRPRSPRRTRSPTKDSNNS